jgi:uncharacterized protein with ATP-grasp and redox domains
MQIQPDCLQCLIKQAARAIKIATDNESVQRILLEAIRDMIPELLLDLNPPEIAQRGYRLIRQISGNDDPFHEVKIRANQMVLDNYYHIKKVLADSQDPLLTASKLAIVSNLLDFGVNHDMPDIKSIINKALSLPLMINDYDEFRSCLNNSRHILYLGDNAGEIVFDRVFIEELHKIKEVDVSFVVRGSPIINDATLDDALSVGMDRVAEIVSNGSDAPATILAQCSPEVQQLYQSADLIIAKGQGNYEALEAEEGHIFFLLMVKCPVVAGMLDVEVGDPVLKQHQLTTSPI